LCYGVFWFWFSSWVSEREKNGKEYNECNYDPWVEDEESPHFLDMKKKRKEAGKRRLVQEVIGFVGIITE